MSSYEPANEMYSVDRSHNRPAPAEESPPETPPDPAPSLSDPLSPLPEMLDVPLGTLIFRAGLLGEEQLEDALQESMRTGKRLGEVLLERGWLNERDLGRMLAGQKGLPFMEVSAADTEPQALELFAEEKAKRQAALPLCYEDGLLVIAVGDPSNELVLESLRRDFGSGFRLVVAPHDQLQQAIAEAYALHASQPDPALAAQPDPPVEAEPQSDFDAQPEQPEPGPEPLLEFSPAAEEAELEPSPEQPSEPEASAEEEPEPSQQPFAGSTPTLLSRMLFPSVRHATQEQPEDDATESPAPEEDLAQLEVAEVPELSISTAEEEAPEHEAAPEPEQSAAAEQPEPQPAHESEQPAHESEQPADEPTPSPHRVLVRLRDGEPLELGRFQTAAEAAARAREAIGEIEAAASESTWPSFAGRYVRPETIVSVDLLEDSLDA